MIYSAKAYLEAGDGNLLEAEATLKAGARRARTREKERRIRRKDRRGEKPREGQRDQGKGR